MPGGVIRLLSSLQRTAGWSSPVARQAHNLKVVGSNPAPATNFRRLFDGRIRSAYNPAAAGSWVQIPPPQPISRGCTHTASLWFMGTSIQDALYSVYVLRNPAGSHYVGLTSDVETRAAQHNTGKSKWTAKRGPWNLIWVKSNLSLSEARQLENLLKRQKGGIGFYRLTGLEPPVLGDSSGS